jgi:[acyl-carrier-protein] S-malonyltransferase
MISRVEPSMTAVLFPGQGSQQPGAGREWVGTPAWSVVERAEGALGEPLGPLLLEADEAELSRTRSAQLSVLLLSLMAWEAGGDELQPVAAFAGHSLGQVTALIAAGVLSFDDGIRLAAARADATQAAADAMPGRMVALLGADEAQAERACKAAPDRCWVANVNAPGQVVLAGTQDGVEAATAEAKALGVRRARPLDVGGAFHTPLMAPAAEALGPVLAGVTFRPPAAPVVTNHDATAHDTGDGWDERLRRHLVEPVRWQASVEAMAAAGVERFVEIGPGSTLSALVKRILPS